MKSVFITGLNGYLGAHIARAFQTAGYEVGGLVHDPQAASGLEQQGYTVVTGDLGEPESYRAAAASADVLVHAARADDQTALLDRTAVETLLETSRGFEPLKAVIYTSGLWVYGGSGGALITEDSPRQPARLVAWRPEMEDLVLNAGGLRGFVLRPGIVYGAGQSHTTRFFEAVTSGNMYLIGDGTNRWAMVQVDDLARAYVQAAGLKEGGQHFNISDGSQYSVAQLAAAAAESAGYKGILRYISAEEAAETLGPLAEALVLDQRVSTLKARTELGWGPQNPDFVRGIDRYLEEWVKVRDQGMAV